MPLYISRASTCDVCHENYDADLATRWPRSLPCGHVFCNLCTDHLWINRNMGKSPCPHCRKESYFWETVDRLYVQYPGSAGGSSDSQRIRAPVQFLASFPTDGEIFKVDWGYRFLELLIIVVWISSLFALLPEIMEEWSR
ncbi:hypothetical protein PENSPDRAFT_695026 [Peniophora sp. CONT]|nr:hypothetical protein PENSPDRAFT_695026 [Peniophora sp. CONT]